MEQNYVFIKSKITRFVPNKSEFNYEHLRAGMQNSANENNVAAEKVLSYSGNSVILLVENSIKHIQFEC